MLAVYVEECDVISPPPHPLPRVCSPLDWRAERALEVMLPFLETQRHALALNPFDPRCS